MFLLLSSSDNFRPPHCSHFSATPSGLQLLGDRFDRDSNPAQYAPPDTGSICREFCSKSIKCSLHWERFSYRYLWVLLYCLRTAKFNVLEPRELSVNEPLGLLWYTLYSREESIPAADVLVTADAVAGLAAAADDPTAALYLEPAAEAEEAPPPPPTSLWPCA